jgi:hypothetical protein
MPSTLGSVNSYDIRLLEGLRNQGMHTLRNTHHKYPEGPSLLSCRQARLDPLPIIYLGGRQKVGGVDGDDHIQSSSGSNSTAAF